MNETARKRKTKKTSSSTDRVTAYAKAVTQGKVVAGPHVRNACRRHLDDLKRKDLVFDVEAANRALRFYESKLFLSEGQFEDQPFRSHPSQDFIIGSIFGWKKKDGMRRFRRAYIEQGKGNGKSPLAGGIGLYGLMADGEAGAEIYSAGATKEQANILFRDAVKMVGKSPDLERRLRISGGPGREFNIAYLRNGSFFRPVSRETKKTGSGPRPHFALIDELHEHPDAGIIEILERGFKFRRQPLLLMITNSGTDRKSVCYAEHEFAVKVAAGNRSARDDDATYLGERWGRTDETFSYVCALDPDDDPLRDPECWVKVNPLMGVTITPDYLEGVVSQARDMPAKLNNILRLHFCVWTDASTAWLTRERVEPALADFDPQEHHGKPVYLGIDLSQNKDITALAAVVETGSIEVESEREGRVQKVTKPTYDAWIEAWTPGDTVQSRADRDAAPYQEWIRKGFLHAPKGESIRYDHVAQALAEYGHDFDIRAVAYDRYAFRRGLEPACNDIGIELPFVEHPQGGVKKGKPTDEMKRAAAAAQREPEGLWMPGSVREFEDALLERRIRLRSNPVLISALMSAVTDEDRWGNYWITKDRSANKIDPAVALCMAIGAAAAHATGGATMKDYFDALGAA